MKSLLIVTSLLLPIFGWGGNSNSSQTKIKFLNPRPVIINSPLTYTRPPAPGSPVGTPATVVNVDANWFLYQIEISNNSPETLYVANTQLTLTGVDTKTGKTVSQTFSLKLNEACNVSPSTMVARQYLAVISPGGVYTHLADKTGCDATKAVGGMPYEQWFVSGLSRNILVWSVQVQAEGWFADAYDRPNERLDLTGTFSTQ